MASQAEVTYEEKREKIEFYRIKFGIRIFIETGTFLGDTIDFFKEKFEFLYSIELSETLSIRAQKRFSNQGNIRIINGNSGEVLGEIVKNLKEPALFWLDGHYSSEFYMNGEYFITAKGDTNTPIEKELDIILCSKIQHIILIDDARLFIGKNDYPTLKNIKDKVGLTPKKYNVLIDTDIIQIIPN
jgi:hypothetical protein